VTEPRERITLIDPASGAALSPLRTWFAIIVMLSGTTFTALVATVLAPVMHGMALHFSRYGHGDLVAYGMATVPSIGIMVGGPLTGRVIERTGTRNFLICILILFALTGSAGLWLDNVWVLIGARFLVGIAGAGIVTATLIMIGEYFTPEMRARMLGYQGAVGAAAAFTIFQLSGQLADFGGWRAPFALYLTALPILLAALAIPPKGDRPVVRREGAAPFAGLVPLLPTLSLIVALFAASYMSTLHISFLLTADGVARPSVSADVLSAGAVMVALGSAIYGPVRLRLGERWSVRLSALLLGVGIATMAATHAPLVVGLGCAIAGLGTGLVNPTVNNMLIARSSAETRGTALGLGYSARYVGNFLNPWLVKPLIGTIGIYLAFLIVGGLFAAGALLDVLVPRRPRIAEAE
jgi:MFS family permease